MLGLGTPLADRQVAGLDEPVADLLFLLVRQRWDHVVIGTLGDIEHVEREAVLDRRHVLRGEIGGQSVQKACAQAGEFRIQCRQVLLRSIHLAGPQRRALGGMRVVPGTDRPVKLEQRFPDAVSAGRIGEIERRQDLVGSAGDHPFVVGSWLSRWTHAARKGLEKNAADTRQGERDNPWPWPTTAPRIHTHECLAIPRKLTIASAIASAMPSPPQIPRSRSPSARAPAPGR